VNAFEDLGSVVIQQFAYIGGLTGQFWSGVLALPGAGKAPFGRWLRLA
jgi:hypothetical protein